MTRRLRVGALVAAGSLVVAAPVALAATPPKKVGTTINLAGNSIGALKPGISPSKVKSLLGKPTSQNKQGFAGKSAALVYQYNKYGLVISFWQGTQGGSTKLQAIRVESPTYRTSKGIRAGSTLSQLHAAYGNAKCFTSRGNGSLPYCVVQTGRNQAQFDVQNGKISKISLGD